MTFTNTLARPARRFLADRIADLAQRLEQLGGRLREGIARVVGQTVAEGVHQAVRAALECRPPAPEERPVHPPPWDGHGGLLPDDVDHPQPFDEMGWEPAPATAPPPPEPARPVPRWRSALWAGLQAAAWWLRNCPGGRPVGAALGFGAAVGLAALAAGPLAAMLVAAAGSALALAALADEARDAAARMLGLART